MSFDINLGRTSNDGSGDSLRVGGKKINDNFKIVATHIGDKDVHLNNDQIDRISKSVQSSSIANNLTTTEEGKILDASQAPILLNLIEKNRGGFVENDDVSILTPKDANKYLGASSTGAIKIKIPQLYTGTRLNLEIKIDEYITGKSATIFLSGYNSLNSHNWYAPSVQTVTSSLNPIVRFGFDGDNHCIYIGELNTVWASCYFVVTKGFFSYKSSGADDWFGGWEISLETSSFQNLTHTFNNNLPL